MKTALHNCTIYTGKQVLTDHAIIIEEDEIVNVIEEASIPGSYNKEDLGEMNITASFIDIQIYGGNGRLFSNELSIASLKSTYQYCLSGGAAHFMITMATNSIENFLKGIEVVKQYWNEGGKGVLGLHLEGPYLNPLKKGAHIESCIKKPTIEEVQMLLEKGKDVVKMITIAPEMFDDHIIQYLLENDIIVSAGHSNASYKQGVEAFKSGIPAATHLFNAMSQFQSREPGMVGAIYDSNAVSSVVCDGVHVDFAAIRISKKLMGDRLFFITDAVAETTSGEYLHVFKGDRYTLPDGTLSGSALTMIKCVKNAVEHVGIDLEEALRMASLYPAKLLGAASKFGMIEKGFKASFVVFDNALNVERIIGQ